MKNSLIQLIVSMLALAITTYVVPGFELESIWAALVTVVILGVINILIRPFILLITLPVNILTLGLFTFVVNGLMLLLASAVVPGFAVAGILPAIVGGIVLALVSAVLSGLAEDEVQ